MKFLPIVQASDLEISFVSFARLVGGCWAFFVEQYYRETREEAVATPRRKIHRTTVSGRIVLSFEMMDVGLVLDHELAPKIPLRVAW